VIEDSIGVLLKTTDTLPPNGERYPLVGGTRQRQFDGTNSRPRKMLENAQSPASQVDAVLYAIRYLAL
jgi:hypothetical protein